jgi:hypothetical protein
VLAKAWQLRSFVRHPFILVSAILCIHIQLPPRPNFTGIREFGGCSYPPAGFAGLHWRDVRNTEAGRELSDRAGFSCHRPSHSIMRFPTVLSGGKHRRVRKLQLLGEELVRLTFASPSMGLYSRLRPQFLSGRLKDTKQVVSESESAGRNRNPWITPSISPSFTDLS